MKTAVEQLIEELQSGIVDFEYFKELEKQQILDAYEASSDDMHQRFSSDAYKWINKEQYYNSTYGKSSENI